jgi:dienelactone hydrolase
VYWNDLNRYADASLKQAGALPCKVLICTGGRDYQVTKTDFDLYHKALADHSHVTFKWYDDLSHLYIRGKVKATPAEYEKAGYFDKRVVDDLVNWMSGD